MNPVRSPGLQRELNLRLMLPVLVIVALTGAFGAYAAQQLMERVFDRWLLDAARSLAGQVQFVDGRASVELSRQAEALITYDVVDRTYFEVTQGGEHLVGQAGVPGQGVREKVYSHNGRTYDARFADEDVRVARVAVAGPGGAEAVVLVAETRIKRERAEEDLLLTMAPVAAFVLIAALIVGFTVRRTMRILERIAARWNERSHAALEPIPLDDMPRELMPFASALNDLLDRIRKMLERERQFAATVAHQLRTPLTGLRLGLARAVDAPDAESMRAVLHELGGTTQRTARLVQQLLALSRLDPEVRADLRLADVDLAALAREVGETYLDAALEKGIELEFESAATTITVKGLPDLLGEALGNLIDNAIRYTPAGGRVLISVSPSPVTVRLEDSGPGIDGDERDAVFERFVRGRTSTGEGSGLGLAIVKEIAALHGARVSLADSALGGACVAIIFPDPGTASSAHA
ncbi:sensor histidine kinase [Azoarcus sp. DN11]|uniref:sensor histidine kinase n=1 Tax=Azoarcus sp. DN11 TaxID=356837 RepID=UPI000EAD0F9D|nr:sensor histidine kinase [Azoarcus sp. DN11]AYH45729.1 hypothetical protein CDA09_20480 [Azoarcus sp. DN11]